MTTALAGLSAGASVACPVCDAVMRPRLTAAGHAGGRCTSCGTTLE